MIELVVGRKKNQILVGVFHSKFVPIPSCFNIFHVCSQRFWPKSKWERIQGALFFSHICKSFFIYAKVHICGKKSKFMCQNPKGYPKVSKTAFYPSRNSKEPKFRKKNDFYRKSLIVRKRSFNSHIYFFSSPNQS